MITKNGYSKDPSLVPEGVVVTWGDDMVQRVGGRDDLLTRFKAVMAQEDGLFAQKVICAPKFKIAHVYIIVDNMLYCRVNFVEYQEGPTIMPNPGTWEEISWKRLVLTGPITLCPFERELKGFRNFRYATRLF